MQIKLNIPFTSLDGYNDLFIDYVNSFNKVGDFFEYPFDSQGLFNSITGKKAAYNSGKISRLELAEILKTQNKFFNSGESSFLNIELLKDPDTFAIVTGQQVGILTGNLYTVIKALNAVQLSRSLSAKYTEFKFVPVFWLEADDHDFLEINNINVFDRNNELINLKYYEKGVEKERYLTPVGRITLDEHIESFKNSLKESMLETEYSEQLFDYINRSYREGIDLTTAFARYFNYIAGDTGLIFCNPSDREIKKLLIPVFEKELATCPHSGELIIEKSAELELKDYIPQVKPRQINLFYAMNNNRHTVEFKEDKYSLKHTRQKFEKNDFFDLLYTGPENFSTNVILRSVCQDFLLPTVAYIGGPSEIAYFAQFKEIYNFFDVKMPVIYPRTSVTILEKRVESFLEKFGLNFEDLFEETTAAKKLLGKMNEINIDDEFGNLIDELNAVIYMYSQKLINVDKNLVLNLKNKHEKYLENINIIRQKFIESQVKLNETTGSRLKSVIQNVYPEGNPQERFINVSYYLNKYGLGFVKDLFNTIEINKHNHQVISLTDSINKDQTTLF
jgi:bacillithiol synthase